MGVQVLMVDDNAGILFLHTMVIEESGFSDNIKTFNRAEPALEFLEHHEDTDMERVVFLDINLPGMNGWDFLKKLETSDINNIVHVVMVSSSVDKTDRDKANEFKHVVGFVEKPLNLKTCEELKKEKDLKHLFSHSKTS